MLLLDGDIALLLWEKKSFQKKKTVLS